MKLALFGAFKKITEVILHNGTYPAEIQSPRTITEVNLMLTVPYDYKGRVGYYKNKANRRPQGRLLIKVDHQDPGGQQQQERSSAKPTTHKPQVNIHKNNPCPWPAHQSVGVTMALQPPLYHRSEEGTSWPCHLKQVVVQTTSSV